jgi:hypothetical protein
MISGKAADAAFKAYNEVTDDMGGDACSGCGAAVRRVITLGAIIRDLEPEPRPTGNHIIVTNDQGEVRAKVLTGPEMPAQQAAYRIHACPPKPAPMPPGPACAACGLPMHAELAASQQWRTHPSCVDPDDAKREALQQIRRKSA